MSKNATATKKAAPAAKKAAPAPAAKKAAPAAPAAKKAAPAAPAAKKAAPAAPAPAAPAAKKAAQKAAPAPAKDAAPAKEIKPGLLVAFRGYSSTEGLTAADMVFQKGDRMVVLKEAEIEGKPQAGQWECQKEGAQVFGVCITDELRVLKQPAIVEPEYAEVADSESVAAALQDSDACEAVEHILKERDRSQFTLGGLLHNVRRTKAYERIVDKKNKPLFTGPQGFVEYCDKRLKLKYRKAMALADIYVTFMSVGITEERVANIGWTKCWKISRHVTEKNSTRLLNFASDPKNSVEDLDDYIKTKILATGESSERGANAKSRGRQSITRFVFSVLGDVGENVIKQALSIAKDKIREDGKEEPSDSQAFAAMATEWLAVQDSAEISEEAFAAMFSARFPGKTLTIA